MRKADYALLAKSIKNRTIDAKSRFSMGGQHASFEQGKIEALRGLAIDFSINASVNKSEFLKACGLE